MQAEKQQFSYFSIIADNQCLVWRISVSSDAKRFPEVDFGLNLIKMN